jgi:Glycosyl transferase family 2
MTTNHPASPYPTSTFRSDGTEWVESVVAEGSALRELRNVLVEVTVQGAAEAAGLSLGPFKDFLVPVEHGHGERRLQLEIDGVTRTWAFRADGVLMVREWWDAAVTSIDDLFGGTLTVKTRWPKEVTFHGLSIRPLESSPRVTVIMTCHRFAQRLRVALASWCRQRVPSGALEIIVLNPESPDGTHEVVASMAAAYPEVRLREIRVAAAHARNKGYMLNRGVEASRGDWIWMTDADCVFAPDSVAHLLGSNADPAALLFGERRHLTKASTDLLLAGRVDPSAEFTLVADDVGFVEAYPWGYTQIVHRSQSARLRYREDLEHFAGSDETFIENWRNAGLPEVRVDGVTCLHLIHPFSWYGTDRYL